MKIELKKPIKIPGPQGKDIETSELQFPTELTARYIKYFPTAWVNGGSQVESHEVIPFLSGLLEIPERYVDGIDFKDILHIMGRLPDFLKELGVTT